MKKENKLTLIILAISLFIFFFTGIDFSFLNTEKRWTNQYCWNKFYWKRLVYGYDPHYLGHKVLGDHICTNEEAQKMVDDYIFQTQVDEYIKTGKLPK